MNGDEYVRDKDKEQLLAALYTDAQVGSKVFEQQRMGIFVRCTEDIQGSIDRFAKSNERLSGRLLWLNIILGIFTIAGTVISVWANRNCRFVVTLVSLEMANHPTSTIRARAPSTYDSRHL